MEKIIQSDIGNLRISKLKKQLNKLIEIIGISDLRVYKKSLELDMEIVRCQKNFVNEIDEVC